MTDFEILLSATPAAPDWKIDWQSVAESPILRRYFASMAQTPQNPDWHGEGAVWTHTKMVGDALAADADFRGLSERKRQILFVAALLHDVGKITKTVLENGVYASPNHTIAGSKIAREILWRDFSLAGTSDAQDFRETVCALIWRHSLPVRFADSNGSERRLFEVAAQGELSPSFSLSLLRILVRADLRGRIFARTADSLDDAELCFAFADELGVLDGPGVFASDVTKFAYLSGKDVWREQELYDETWGEVTILSGLPGTGKDTWIRRNRPDLPTISLDDIRRELKIDPTDDQGAVANVAKERAKDFLRQKTPFVWNATNITPQLRGGVVGLCARYGAATRLVFLETDWKTELERNRNRKDAVPESAIERMLRKLEPPTRGEARNVDWVCF